RPDINALTLLARLNSNKGNYEQAIALGERAVALEPSNAWAHATLGFTLNLAGRPEEAVPINRQAIRLYPHPPLVFYGAYGTVNFNAGRYDAAIKAFKEGVKSPDKGLSNHRMHLALIASLMALGREKEARHEAEQYRKYAEYSFEKVVAGWRRFGYKDPAVPERMIELIRKAGFE
ncbi:MAG: tetratricopeptide repeat protein, partial [Candidatus Glassbacteria bacterium]|nr:tetratricopeptide repeat protein [Candidatus Glassbacteria bacterium]